MKLQKWDELDDLFNQCWKYKSPDRYETLADLVLVIHSSMIRATLDFSYQNSRPIDNKLVHIGTDGCCRDLTCVAENN